MKKLLVLSVGGDKCCLDMVFVDSVHTGDEITIKLSELPDDYKVFNLNALFGRSGSKDDKHLILFAGEDMHCGLLADFTVVVSDVAEAAIQAMPKALGVVCRKCFPEVVILENEALPLMTPAGVLRLAEVKSTSDRKVRGTRGV